MNSIRSLSSLAICLCVLTSACPLGSSASVSTSLWGKKVPFRGHPCLWQLHPGVVVPALRELSVCMYLRRTFSAEWTGFVYKAPGNRQVELGLGGIKENVTVTLFGKEWQWENKLTLNEWHSVCLTWSGPAQRLKIYVDRGLLGEVSQPSSQPQQLSENGTLTLGVSHFVKPNGEVQAESGNNLLGEIGVFRMWAREWGYEEVRGLSCADGDVVSWDLRQWNYDDCDPEPDENLHCACPHYKIKMQAFIVLTRNPGNYTVSLEEITRNWLESIFPDNISIHNIIVSSPCHNCHMVNNSAILHEHAPQGLELLSKPTCEKCFNCEVYVKVDPPANAEVVQTNITALLHKTSYNFPRVVVDPSSISILPVEQLVEEAPLTVSPLFTTKTGPTRSPSTPPTSMSTTEKLLDFNVSGVRPDKFFRVNVTINMTGSPAKPEYIIEKWVKFVLEVNDTVTVLNLVIRENASWNMEQYTGLRTSHDQQKHYFCTFHVREYSKNSVEEIKNFMYISLTRKYQYGSTTIESKKLMIKFIEPDSCLKDTTLTIYGKYTWPKTLPQVTAEMGCIEPRSERAYRLCKLDNETDMTSWADPDMRKCSKFVTISDLDNITVTPGNAGEVVDIIQDLVDIQLGNSSELSPSHLESVVEKLNEVVDESIINSAVGANIVSIVSDILLSETDVTPVSNTVLELTSKMGDIMDFQGESASLTAPSLGFSMINVDPDQFSGLTFGASIDSPTMNPEIFVNQSFVSKPYPKANAMITLPSTLNSFFSPGERNTTRVQFQFYGTHELFQDIGITNTTQSNWTLNSYIVSANINNSHVINLKDPVVVTLSHQNPKQPEDKVQCMFWDFQKNGGQGGWNSSGCETQSISSYQTSCLCDHLTHFAVLLDVSRTPISKIDFQILTVISYTGCGISSIFLGITILTYLIFEKLRQDYPAKILINLSAALQGLTMLFLLNSWLSSFSNHGLCVATAVILHYFLLASFTWMGLEAVHMYLALVKVFNIYIPSYILKLCVVGWGIPLVIVSLLLAIDKDAYGIILYRDNGGSLHSPNSFCWLQKGAFLYVTVAFIALVLLCNMSVFIVVLIQIRWMGTNKLSANRRSSVLDMKAVASLTVLLGLTWSFGFFSIGPAKGVFIYLFTFLNSLQGFFVFLFHCLMKENVRKQWRIHLCCGRFRLIENSDWCHSVNVGNRCKKNNLVNLDSVASDCSQQVSNSSSEAALNHHR